MKKAISSIVFTAVILVLGSKISAQNVQVTESFYIGEAVEIKVSDLELQRAINLKGVKMVDYDRESRTLTVVYELSKVTFEDMRTRVKSVFTVNIDAQAAQNFAREQSSPNRRVR